MAAGVADRRRDCDFPEVLSKHRLAVELENAFLDGYGIERSKWKTSITEQLTTFLNSVAGTRITNDGTDHWKTSSVPVIR